MRLCHVPLQGLTPYSHASRLQELLVRRLLDHKAARSPSAPPDPTVLTAQFHPVYTCGRREASSISQERQDYLRNGGRAEFHAALRGGQTTFHGPGQVVAYPILDLRRHGLTPRSYVCLLEGSVIDTCAEYGVTARRTENPGVWVTEDDKICALGVHLRRNITSHGIGFNVTTEPMPFFHRIVACGLENKRVTSLHQQGVRDVTVTGVADMFVEKLRHRLGIEEALVKPEDLLEQELEAIDAAPP